MGAVGLLSIGIAATLDALLGEPPNRVHPVAYFGRLVARVDRQWSHPRAVGIVAAVALPVIPGAVAWGFVDLAHRWGWLTGAVAAGLVLYWTTSLRMLVTTARSVIEDSVTELGHARETVPALVGRDPDALSPDQLRSAAVESAAENLADGLLAPLLAFALGTQLSLALGAVAAAWVKSVNTLDSMLGYRSKPVGWASAMLDDLVMFVPSRAAAIAIALAARRPTALLTARRWARTPPSPNSGWPMTTLATALDVRLVKPGVYDLNPDGALPDVVVGRRGVRLVSRAGVLSILACGVITWH
jgi:adenosylcobinamide-phosphate synthase